MVCYISLENEKLDQRPCTALEMREFIKLEGNCIVNNAKRSSTDEMVLTMGPVHLNRCLPAGMAALTLHKWCQAQMHMANSAVPNSVPAPKSNDPEDVAVSLLRACQLNGDGEYMVNGVRLNAWYVYSLKCRRSISPVYSNSAGCLVCCQ